MTGTITYRIVPIYWRKKGRAVEQGLSSVRQTIVCRMTVPISLVFVHICQLGLCVANSLYF